MSFQRLSNYERTVKFAPTGYLPFGQEAYERGRHFVKIWNENDIWKFRIYRFGKPRTQLVNRAKQILKSMNAPLTVLGQTKATAQDWALWVKKVTSNRYNYTWTEFYFSEHQIPASSPWLSSAKGPLWADVDPLALLDMRIYDRAEQEYGAKMGGEEYEQRVVGEGVLEGFTNKVGEIEEVENKLYNAIKTAPLGLQVLCPECSRFNKFNIDDTSIQCKNCGKIIDVSQARKTKKTLTYDDIIDQLKTAKIDFRITKYATAEEYWFAITADGPQRFESEKEIIQLFANKDSAQLEIRAITDEAMKMLQAEMPSIEEIKEAAYEKFEEIRTEENEEELALVANEENRKILSGIIESIDSKGFKIEAGYLMKIMKGNK